MFNNLLTALYTTKWGRRLGWGLLAITFLMLIVLVYQILSAWREDYLLAHYPPKPSHVLSTHTETAKMIAAIPEQHIFGHAPETGLVPITSLQLQLVGVIQTIPEGNSRVIISKAGNPGKVYRIGDSLTSGVKINAVTPTGVILDNSGSLEKLPLSRPPLQFQDKPKSFFNFSAEEE
jgi:type II secretory pathway component PulC